MKPGAGPSRRTPLRQSRRAMPARSSRRPDTWAADAVVRAQIMDRDGRCRLAGVSGAGACFGGLTPHHRRKSSARGAYSVQNLVALCVHHNNQLEADADLAALARRLGLVVREGDPEWESLGTRPR